MNQAFKIIYTVLLLLCLTPLVARAAALPGIPEFIDEMVAKHQFKRAELQRVFSHAQHLPNVIETISRPSTLKPWMEYRSAFVNPERISRGLKFWKLNQNSLQNAEKKYGVPQEIILAVIGVETVYGRDVGNFRTIDVLTTLAFDYPRRADFFRSELENYLLLAREQRFDLLAVHGSFAGALGIPQFMPSSYRALGVDFNGNHRVDLLGETADAIGSVASFLKANGWNSEAAHVGHTGEIAPIAVRAHVSEEKCPGEIATPRTLAAWSASGVLADENIAQVQNETARLVDFTVGEGKEFWLAFNNFDVIKRYNNSDYYAMSVLQLAEAVKAARKSEAEKQRSAAKRTIVSGKASSGAKKTSSAM